MGSPLGEDIVTAIGPAASAELLEMLSRSEEERAAVIGGLALRDDASWLADLLVEIESDPDDITRLRLIHALREMLASD
jgi:hypothetical protein